MAAALGNMHPSSSITLMHDDPSIQTQLLAFPLISEKTETGTTKLQPQVRMQSFLSTDSQKYHLVFINTYGFIAEDFNCSPANGFVPALFQPKSKVLSSAMVTLGAVPADTVLQDLQRDLIAMRFKVRKSASRMELILFSTDNVPATLTGSSVWKNKGVIADTATAVKAPGRISCDAVCSYCITFISFCFFHSSALFKVPKPLLNFETAIAYSLVLQVELEFPNIKDTLHEKYLKVKDSKWYCTIDIHIGNLLKRTAKQRRRTPSEIMQKVRKMGFRIGLYDLWGPTIVVELTGSSSKSLHGFFSSERLACHPVSQYNPHVGQLIWAHDVSITGCHMIISELEKKKALAMADLTVSDAVAVNTSIKSLSPFRLFKKYKGKTTPRVCAYNLHILDYNH
ncbi:matrix protein [Paraavulavirus neophemae]|uniref:Matrix protein n=1 Tax=Paraavulavirus wisconsinense TaxID=3052594 RepID=B5L5T7_9MONO|nr:matrix protein [Paraavulavirus wisconsinense]